MVVEQTGFYKQSCPWDTQAHTGTSLVNFRGLSLIAAYGKMPWGMHSTAMTDCTRTKQPSSVSYTLVALCITRTGLEPVNQLDTEPTCLPTNQPTSTDLLALPRDALPVVHVAAYCNPACWLLCVCRCQALLMLRPSTAAAVGQPARRSS